MTTYINKKGKENSLKRLRCHKKSISVFFFKCKRTEIKCYLNVSTVPNIVKDN